MEIKRTMSESDIANGILDYIKQYPGVQYNKESLLRNIRQNNDTFGFKENKESSILKLLEGKVRLLDGDVSSIKDSFILKNQSII